MFTKNKNHGDHRGPNTPLIIYVAVTVFFLASYTPVLALRAADVFPTTRDGAKATAETHSLLLTNSQDTPPKPEPVLIKYFASVRQNPSDEIAWVILQRLGDERGFVVWRFHVPIKVRVEEQGRESRVILNEELIVGGSGKEIAAGWAAFGQVKLEWRKSEFSKRHPEAKGYRPTFEEEYAAFEALVKTWVELKRKNLGLADNQLDILAMIHRNGLLDAYIYLQQYREEFGASYKEWARSHPEKLTEYFQRYVLIPKNAIPDYVSKDLPNDEFHRRDKSSAEASFVRDEVESPEANPAALESRKKSNEQQFQLLDRLAGLTTKSRNDYLLEASAYSIIGINYRHLGQYTHSLTFLNKALRIYEEFNELASVALTYNLLGNTHLYLSDYQSAVSLKSKALALYKQINAPAPLQINTLLFLAEIHSASDDYGDAIRNAREAFLLAKEKGLTGGENAAVRVLNRIYSTLFTAISWNVKTGRPREGRPADFVNDKEVGEGTQKYGSKSPKEDVATFTTLAIWQNFKHADLEAGRLTKHIRKEMSNGNFVPAAKYLFAKYVSQPYVRAVLNQSDASADVIFKNKRLELQGPSISLRVLVEAQQGNFQPMFDYFKSTGLYADEEIESFKREYVPLTDDVSFEEVNANIKKFKAGQGYIPPHILQIISLFDEGYNFARSQNIGAK